MGLLLILVFSEKQLNVFQPALHALDIAVSKSLNWTCEDDSDSSASF